MDCTTIEAPGQLSKEISGCTMGLYSASQFEDRLTYHTGSTMKIIIIKYACIILIAFLVSCTNSYKQVLVTPTSQTAIAKAPPAVSMPSTDTPEFQSHVMTQVPTFTLEYSPTTTNSPTVTNSPTPIIPAEANLLIKEIKFEPDLPKTEILTGTIVLVRYKDQQKFLLNISTWTTQTIDSSENISFLEISPNQNMIAYKGADRLVINNTVEKSNITLPWEIGWSVIYGWLDNQQLQISKSNDESVIASTIVLNLFTNGRKELKPDYPDLETTPNYDYWGPDIYSPDLRLVLYPRRTGDKNNRSRIVLWDRYLGQAVAFFTSINNPYGRTPVWSIDGGQFIMALAEQSPAGSVAYELFKIDRDGQVFRLTNLRYYFWSVLDIDHYIWSPDMKHLAFQLRYGWGSSLTDSELAVLDMDTLQVTIYHAPGEIDNPYFAWSPNGQKLIFEYYDEQAQVEQMTLLDLRTSIGFKIGADSKIIGWLK